MKRIRQEWFDRDYVLRFFGSTDGNARRAYLLFLEEEMGIDRESELSGGGLVRSHGGWSNVLSMRKQGLKEQGDERIPGGGEFLQSLAETARQLGVTTSAIKFRDARILFSEYIRASAPFC